MVQCRKGFGFITSEAHDRDIFLHRVALERAGIEGAETGDMLQFDVKTRDDEKLAAHSVEKIDQTSDGAK